jgi:hypothetical protein
MLCIKLRVFVYAYLLKQGGRAQEYGKKIYDANV